ncbi:MAG: CDP-alcohol phosphatidyltransferase family protein [Anaerolineales bacterium]|nr:CDP-alcohol phosphatidyltransferase family protein [Anaerolineales bacterium]
MNDIKKHHRVNDILLGPLERPALQWLSKHMPGWVTPDILTGIGVLGALLIFVAYGLSNLSPAYFWLASLGFVINWFGDSLDGTLARYRHIERPKYGFFIDHTIDGVSMVLVFCGLGISPYVSFDMACLLLSAYLLLCTLAYIRTSVAGEFKISYGKLGPTEFRAIGILLNIYMFFAGNQMLELGLSSTYHLTISVYDIIVMVVIMILFGFFAYTAIKQAIELKNMGE